MTGSDDTRRPRPDGGPSPLDEAAFEGHSIESLSDYLDRDRQPADPTIESSPAAQHALAALARLRAVAPRVLASEADSYEFPHDHWITRILDQISVQVRAGRDIPVAHDVPTAVLSITEGAVRGVVRDVGDGFAGMLVERVRLDGDIESPGARAVVTVDIVTFAGTDVAAVGEEFGRAVRSALAKHTELSVTDVVVRVRDTGLTDEEVRDR